MSAERPAGLTGPTTRTRSVWLWQLVLAAGVLACALAVLTLAPALLSTWTFATGLVLLMGITLATILLPWQRLPAWTVALVPFADIVGVALLAFDNQLSFDFLWVFPITWVASYFRLSAMIGSLALVATALVVETAVDGGALDSPRLVITLVALTFIAITSFLANRQTGAFKQLLRRQAAQLRRTVERVQTQDKRTTSLINGLDVGVVRIDRATGAVRINDAYRELYGVDEDLSQPARAVEYASYRGEPLAADDRLYSRAARGEEFEHVTVWLFVPTGEWRAISASSKPLEGEPGDSEDESMLLVVQDVTPLLEAQRTREQFRAAASHEMRNPLTAILGHAELALDSEGVDERTRGHLEVIERAGERMLTMISTVLSESRGAFEDEDAVEPLDLRDLLAASMESFGPAAAVKRIEVGMESPDPLRIVGDAYRLRQVVDNVLSNAIKYTPEGGDVHIRGRVGDGRVEVDVTDDGIGISADDLPRLFDPYFRTEAAREFAPGTGLGMGISRDIVRSQGGDLRVSSTEGAGTTMTIVLPRPDDRPDEGQPEEREGAHADSGL
jgi:two-component system, OmpR family, phosphate regulon sensor histidine kinase PhoR